MSKIDPPWKRPKCHLNGQNWHFVKSEPPGPALFEFQGVPRDPVLRPKSDPLILNGKTQLHFHLFYIFSIYHFHVLWHFYEFIKLQFWSKWCFCSFWLKALCVIQEGEWECVVFSPLIVFRLLFYLKMFCSRCRGEIQGGDIFLYSRSPLYVYRFLCWFYVWLVRVGEIHRVEM